MAEVAAPPSAEALAPQTIAVHSEDALTDATNGASDGGKIVTVFDDAANFNVKHQLQHTWTLWFTKPPSGKQDWNELLKEVISFDSVEEFWGIYVSLLSTVHTTICLGADADIPIYAEQHHSCL